MQLYTHCDGSPLQLADGNIGSEQYNSSEYYIWHAGTRRHQLLFTFPTRVNLTTITLYYYNESGRGLPSLRFYVVPDDFNIWDALTTTNRYVDVAAVSPPEEIVGLTNVSINFHVNTQKVLMVNLGSSFQFALSEVDLHYYNIESVLAAVTHLDRKQ